MRPTMAFATVLIALCLWTHRAVAVAVRGGAKPLLNGIAAGDGCLGLVDEMCKPCPKPEQNKCAAVKAECAQVFCDPLCLRLTYRCVITADQKSPFAAAQYPPYSEALCSCK